MSGPAVLQGKDHPKPADKLNDVHSATTGHTVALNALADVLASPYNDDLIQGLGHALRAISDDYWRRQHRDMSDLSESIGGRRYD